MTTTDRRTSVKINPADWTPGQYGVLDLDRLCPNGPCAGRNEAPGAWLPAILDALEKERVAA